MFGTCEQRIAKAFQIDVLSEETFAKKQQWKCFGLRTEWTLGENWCPIWCGCTIFNPFFSPDVTEVEYHGMRCPSPVQVWIQLEVMTVVGTPAEVRMTSEWLQNQTTCRHPAVTLVTFCPCLLIRGLWTRRVHLQGTDGKTLHCLASLIYLRSDLDPVDPSFPLVLYSLLCFGCILNVDNVVSIPSLPLICQHFVARSPGRQARAALDLQHHPTFPSSFNIFQHLSTLQSWNEHSILCQARPRLNPDRKSTL